MNGRATITLGIGPHSSFLLHCTADDYAVVWCVVHHHSTAWQCHCTVQEVQVFAHETIPQSVVALAACSNGFFLF